MFLDDDSEPKTKKSTPKPLDRLSVAELAEYRDALRDEIVRVEAEMARKEKHRDAMDALFKKSDG